MLADAGVLTVVANAGQAHPQGVTVYNLEVEQAHTYFVLAEHAPDGADAVWVHNADYRIAQERIVQERLARGLPAFDPADPLSGTIARISNNRRSFYGVQGRSGQLANVSTADRQRWLSKLQSAGFLRGRQLSDVNSLNHAEAMALMQAADGLGSGLGKRLTINVDRITCGWCKNDGGLRSLKEYLQLDRLTIVDKAGGKVRV